MVNFIKELINGPRYAIALAIVNQDVLDETNTGEVFLKWIHQHITPSLSATISGTTDEFSIIDKRDGNLTWIFGLIKETRLTTVYKQSRKSFKYATGEIRPIEGLYTTAAYITTPQLKQLTQKWDSETLSVMMALALPGHFGTPVKPESLFQLAESSLETFANMFGIEIMVYEDQAYPLKEVPVIAMERPSWNKRKRMVPISQKRKTNND